MKDVISINVRNNTPVIQPVTLFTNGFDIPSNLVFGVTATFSYDLSGETFPTNPVNIYVQVSTQPITPSTPFTSVPIAPAPYSTTSVLNALNSLGFGTWTQSGNTITTTSQTYYWGDLKISPTFETAFDNIVGTYNGYVQLSQNSNILGTYPMIFPSSNQIFDAFIQGSSVSVTINKPLNSEGYILTVGYKASYSSPFSVFYNSGNQFGSLQYSWANPYQSGYYAINITGLP